MERAVIETSFATESGYGNPVFSKLAVQNNAEYMGQLYGPKKEFSFVANRSIDTGESRDYMSQESKAGAETAEALYDTSAKKSKRLVRPKG